MFLTSKRKKSLIEDMKKPEGYSGPSIVVVLREPNVDKQTENFDAFLREALGKDFSGAVGTFTGE